LPARLAGASRPASVLGGDGWQAGAGAALAGLAAASGIPILCDWRAYAAVPHDSPAWSGWLGYGRAYAVAGGCAEADLLIFIGCTRADVASGGFTIGFGAETVLVSLDTEATQHAGRTDQHILASPGTFTEARTSVDADALRGGRS